MPATQTANLYDVLAERDLIAQATHDDIRDRLARPVTGYCGFDPTADSLHVGSLVPIMALAHMQRCGHKPLVVMGGATAMVGDPSGKTDLRRMLTREQIDANALAVSKQIENIVRFDDSDTGAALLNNADWLSEKNWIEMLRDIGPHFSVNRMLSMESVKGRINSDEGITYLEFSYMIMQAYDFLHLYRERGCTLQVGGQDQWGNIVMGIELIRRLEGPPEPAHDPAKVGKAFSMLPNSNQREIANRRYRRGHHSTDIAASFGWSASAVEQVLADAQPTLEKYCPGITTVTAFNAFGLTFPLVTKADGGKFGKTEQGNIWLDAQRTSPYDFYQFWRNTADADVGRFLRFFTFLPIDEIRELERAEGAALNEAKERLAYETTKLIHGESEADAAMQSARKAFGAAQDVTGEAIPHDTIAPGELRQGVGLLTLMTRAGLAGSNSEARRLVQGGGVRIHDQRIDDPQRTVTDDDVRDGYVLIRAGKKKLFRYDVK